MPGKHSSEFSFDAETERTFHTRPREARLVRHESEGSSDHSSSEYEKKETMAEDPPPPERFLGEYKGENALAGRLTIVNQPVNVANFQLYHQPFSSSRTDLSQERSMKMPISICRDSSA